MAKATGMTDDIEGWLDLLLFAVLTLAFAAGIVALWVGR
jgi:hypothetical protein